MPTCNIYLLGAQKEITAGFSAATQHRHIGFAFQSDVASEHRMKIRRTFGAKWQCVLAAGVDLEQIRSIGMWFNISQIKGRPSSHIWIGRYGDEMREKIDKQMDQLD
jgi:U4/U6 small nuclear ribonucleoprotein PRP31